MVISLFLYTFIYNYFITQDNDYDNQIEIILHNKNEFLYINLLNLDSIALKTYSIFNLNKLKE